ncbi:MAG: tRNA (guanosine(46)-N7)-methyltransferase TrmB [Deltaproteobacteria bacterium]|nr:tRNA (guanosine(46)-N7)-methyltransferase TrmB [Deltaproteobacteria bacterium]
MACTDYFSIEPNSLFGREAPLEVEIGAGRGDFILSRAAALPQRNFLAVELALPMARLLAERAAQAQLQNVRIMRTDARPLVNLFLPSASVSAYYVYFPDPWPKTRHAKRRLFTPWFVANLRRTMTTGALLFVATDMHVYANSIFSLVKSERLRPTAEPAAGLTATGFARKFMAEGRTVYARAFAK